MNKDDIILNCWLKYRVVEVMYNDIIHKHIMIFYKHDIIYRLEANRLFSKHRYAAVISR